MHWEFLAKSRFFKVLLCIFIITLLVQKRKASSISVHQDNKTNYVSGVVRTNLTDPLFYTTYFPIIYEIPVPKWNPLDLNLKWMEHMEHDTNCKEELGEGWDLRVCSLAWDMQEVAVERIHATFLDWQLLNSNTNSMKSIDSIDCQEILPHFTSYSLGLEETVVYLNETLPNCQPISDVVYGKLNPDPAATNMSMYGVMLSHFLESYIASEENTTTFNKFRSTTIAYIGLQALKFLDEANLASKWSQAISTCGNEQIPYSLIPQDSLASSLKKVENILALKLKNKFQLTIDAQDFSSYYKHSIADCIFTNNSFMVRILVPLKRVELEYKLSLVVPVPFMRHFGKDAEVCRYNFPEFPVIVEEHTGFYLHSDCDPGELCLVPDFASRPPIDYCYHALLSNSSQDILDFCEIECNHLALKHLPYIRRISPDTFVILGRPNGELIHVNCDGRTYKFIEPPLPTGALEVTLPCSCQLVLDEDVLHSFGPFCGNELKLREILPLSWSPNATENGNLTRLKSGSRYNAENINSKDDQVVYSDPEGPLRVKLYILSGIVLILFCFTGLLMLILNRQNKRIVALEKCNAQGCANYFENPLQMSVRANDD